MRKLAFALAAFVLAGVGAFAPVTAPAAFAAVNPKVAIIVGATHGTTSTYRTYANQIYAEAIKYTTNVVKVYSPSATWSRVKSAVNGASIVVYLGHGNGWPSPYTYDPEFKTKDGFGLNYDNNGDGKLSDYENKYYGEPKIETLTPAPNAVVLLFHLCYASGNSEPGDAEPSLSIARQRVDNYASAFLRAGARAVIANGHSHDPYYIRALFTTRQTIEQYWRNAPDFHNHVLAYPSSRTSGSTYLMDPESSAPRSFYRSIVGKMSLTTDQVTGASYASTAGDPATFAVPGNASPKADGSPVFGSAADAAASVEAPATPTATVGTADKVRIDAKETATAADGSAIFRIHTDAGVEGWMTGSSLMPRDSLAPRVWTVEDGTGAFSPNGDSSQDSYALALRISEQASWSLKVLDGGGATLASSSGTDDKPTLAWKPAAGAVPDGTYGWSLTARDAWGNGPLTRTGKVIVDTETPSVSVAVALAATPPLFTPNGDGSRDTIGFGVGSTEPGSVTGTAKNAGGTAVGTFSIAVGSSGGTLAWDGKTQSGAWAPDGAYTIDIVARDLAGNRSAPQARPVLVYGALGYVRTSNSQFFPQDGDSLMATTSLSFVLRSPATVTWTVVNGAGTVVRTIKDGAALAAGTWRFTWNGRNDAGAYVPRGTYRSVVTATGPDDLGASQAVSVLADAFRITPKDSTPARRQKVSFTVVSTEAVDNAVKLRVYQPGISSWAVTMTRVSGRTYKATITFRSSAAGTVRIKASAKDSRGVTQSSWLSLPLH